MVLQWCYNGVIIVSGWLNHGVRMVYNVRKCNHHKNTRTHIHIRIHTRKTVTLWV
jgi:hypothetical protein